MAFFISLLFIDVVDLHVVFLQLPISDNNMNHLFFFLLLFFASLNWIFWLIKKRLSCSTPTMIGRYPMPPRQTKCFEDIFNTTGINNMLVTGKKRQLLQKHNFVCRDCHQGLDYLFGPNEVRCLFELDEFSLVCERSKQFILQWFKNGWFDYEIWYIFMVKL